ncbi:MAG TPA: NAD(P)/FAD-dependent oxidoreductase [Chloroflexota bacterium]|nr:NAD(P)/FAD-dependent oxidoreductase [Chloroflexota bacterium]
MAGSSPENLPLWDAIVVGGGVAGLACALMLGRYRRRAIVVDDGHPRNGATTAIHGIPFLVGVGPWELRERSWEEIARYPTIQNCNDTALRAGQEADGTLWVETGSGRRVRGKRLLLATGVEDILPDDIAGFRAFYGKTIHHCPDCDGYQATDKAIGLIAWGDVAAPYAMDFLNWTDRITVLTNGHPEDEIPESHRKQLERFNIPIETRPLARFEGADGTLTGVRFRDGTSFPCEVVYFYIGQHPRNDLARQLGCKLNKQGHVVQDRRQRTSVENVFAAGDIAPPDETVAVALAQGQVAAIVINRSLYGERWMG